MSARVRKFEHNDKDSIRWVDYNENGEDQCGGVVDTGIRRHVVLQFLSTIEPSDVYGIVEPDDSPHRTTVVYYRATVKKEEIRQILSDLLTRAEE
jgi:hypothetical protein